MLIASLMLAAYLLGSIPFGLLIGFSRGVDIRTRGSGNIGATNTGRVLGRKWGLLCLTLDVLKGLAPTFVAGHLLVGSAPVTSGLLLAWMAVGAAAVLGHIFPVYLGLRGGKGVSTMIGVALGIYPYFTLPLAVALLGYAVVRFGTGLVSLGSLVLALLLPAGVLGYLAWRGLPLRETWPLPVVAAALALLIVVRHRGNIARMLRGQEPRYGDSVELKST